MSPPPHAVPGLDPSSRRRGPRWTERTDRAAGAPPRAAGDGSAVTRRAGRSAGLGAQVLRSLEPRKAGRRLARRLFRHRRQKDSACLVVP